MIQKETDYIPDNENTEVDELVLQVNNSRVLPQRDVVVPASEPQS